MSNGSNDAAKGLLAFGLGVVAGSIAALLLAPATGEETRRRIGGIASKVTDRAKQTVGNAKDFVGAQKDRLGVAVDAGRQAYLRESDPRSGLSGGGSRPDGV
jgi:hypothetical protein